MKNISYYIDNHHRKEYDMKYEINFMFILEKANRRELGYYEKKQNRYYNEAL